MANLNLEVYGLNLSAGEIKELTGWDDAMVDDYLGTREALLIMANQIDVLTQKVEQLEILAGV